MTHTKDDVRSALRAARDLNLGPQESWDVIHKRLGLTGSEVIEFVDNDPDFFEGSAPYSWAG